MSAATRQGDDGSVEMTIGPDDAATLVTADDDPAAAGRPAPSVDPLPEAVDERDRRPARRGRLGSIAGLLVLIVFSFVTVGVTVARHAALSPIDEAAHIDSVFRAPSIVRTGELMLPQTLDEISCRGVAQIVFTPPPCGVFQAAPPAGYAIGGGGYNTADIHPPIYYDITKLAITLGGFLPLDPVTLMRLTGVFWLALGACLTWLLARRLGAGRWAAFGAGATLAAGYSVQEMSSIVNVDAMVLATGAGFALLALWAWPKRSAWWLLPLAAVVVMFVKMTNIAGLVVVCLFLLIREAVRPLAVDGGVRGWERLRGPERLRAWWSANGSGTGRALGVGALTGLAAGLALAVWSAIRSTRALVPGDSLPISQQFLIDHLTLEQIASQAFSFTAPTEFLPNGLSLKFIGSYGPIALVAVWAGLLALTVAAWFRDRAAFAALAAAVACLAVMPALYVVLNYIASHQFFTPWFRYGFSMMPFVVAAIAAGFRRRAGGVFFAALGGIAMISALVAL
jgi:hypothetical protein